MTAGAGASRGAAAGGAGDRTGDERAKVVQAEPGGGRPARRPPEGPGRPVGDGGPERTCVGCRSRGSRPQLIRMVLDRRAEADGEGVALVVIDERRSMPGRGVWLHPDPRCLAQAERRRGFPRGLRIAGPVDLSRVEAWFAVNVVDEEAGWKPMGTR